MSSSSAFSPDPLSPNEELCYVRCHFCLTVLAVSVPCSSSFKIVTVRCGHCTNLLSVNMRGVLLPPAATKQEEIPNVPSNMLMNPTIPNEPMVQQRGGIELDIPKTPPVVSIRKIMDD